MFYKKGLNISHSKDCWNFLKDHFQYDTMNSWNQLKSIANNVKVYNLDLTHDPYYVLGALQWDDYDVINDMIYDWERNHNGYKVGFNGRSGGYIVLYNEHNNGNILPNYLIDYDDYEEFKEYNCVSSMTSDIIFYTKLVQDFDKLCDNLTKAADDIAQIYKEICEEEQKGVE